jgi:uncharacterized protein
MTVEWRSEWKKLAWGVGIFAICFALPVDRPRFNQAVLESLALVKWYAQEHVLLCLIPAFFIAGAIGVFIIQASVMKYLGPRAPKPLAYGVASVSGTILAVCSCTVLPLFAGIWRMGAGLGPACAFLYSGPAINVLAIILTARVLGVEIGIARAVGAIVFSIVIGVAMHLIYRKEETAKADAAMAMPDEDGMRPLWQNVLYFGAMVGILVFANFGRPGDSDGIWHAIWSAKWLITSGFAVALSVILVAWFRIRLWQIAWVAAATAVAWRLTVVVMNTVWAGRLSAEHLPWEAMIPFAVAVVGLSIILARRTDALGEWFSQSWTFAKQITPLLLFGVLVAGFLLGRPGEEGLIPSGWVAGLVGGNSLQANLFAAVVGAFMYFATLTEVPILQGLMGAGMGKGPALALLLAGPALSLPNMLVIRSIMGTRKTIVFISLVVVMATISGMIYGAI